MPALADPVEAVRDGAFRALQTSVAHFAKTHPGHVLPHFQDIEIPLLFVRLLGNVFANVLLIFQGLSYQILSTTTSPILQLSTSLESHSILGQSIGICET